MRKVYVEGLLLGHSGTDANLRFNECLYVSIPTRLVHQSIPPSETAQEWSPDVEYSWPEALYLSVKHGLEYLDTKKPPVWQKPLDHSTKRYRLRKPLSAEDLVKKVFNDFKSGKIPTDDIAYNILINDANLEIGLKE